LFPGDTAGDSFKINSNTDKERCKLIKVIRIYK